MQLGYGRLINNDFVGDLKDRGQTGSYVSSRIYGTAWGGKLPTRAGEFLEFRLQADIKSPDNLVSPAAGGSPLRGFAQLRLAHALSAVRIRAGAFDLEQPDQEFLVSPNHRMLVKGAIARDLLNTPEVLVAAKDLVNSTTVTRDTQVKEVTYIHLMLPSHQIVLANGVETESFHPASTALTTIPEEDRARLARVNDQIEADPNCYGGHARRILSKSEAAILTHEAA